MKTAFDSLHPTIPCLFFLIALVFAMAAFQPVYVVISALGALVYYVKLYGLRSALLQLRWQLPLVVLIALLNPLFSASGSTELFRIGTRAFYLESFCYGACMGLMLISVILICANASKVLSSDKVMAVFGKRFPSLSVMCTMILRLVPRFLTRHGQIQLAENCCVPAASSSMRARVAGASRRVSVLMAWSMEDSLETADAMRSRGWGVAKRTTYRRYVWHTRDIVVLSCLLILSLAAAVPAATAVAAYSFYPVMSTLNLWWGYLPYILLVAFPLVLEGEEWTKWNL